MKKLLLAILVIGVAGVGVWYFMGGETEPTQAPSNNTSDNFEPDASSATFTFDDKSVTLSNGKAETAVAAGSAMMEETMLLDKFAYGDINADGKNDTALVLAQFGAGSGTFIYVAGYVSGPVTYKGTNTVLVGDRITPTSISISQGGIITFNYLDRKPDEPLAAEPTVAMTMQFVIRNGELVER